MPEGSDHDQEQSIEHLTDRREAKRFQYPGAGQGELITLEVRPRKDVKGNFNVASLKLKGELPVGEDLNAGERLTVSVANADGEVIAAGVYEVGLPSFKDVKAKGAGIIGTERAHHAKFLADE